MWTDHLAPVAVADPPAAPRPDRLAPLLDQLATPSEARVAARADGWAEGHQEGTAAARAEHAAAVAGETARIADTTRRCAALLDALAGAVSSWQAAAAALTRADVTDTVEAALRIAEAVLGHELAHTADPAAAAVARALALLPPGEAELRIDPADLPLLGPPATDRPLRIVADPAVGPGGCVASTAATTVDARVGAALSRVAAALCGDEPPSPGTKVAP